MAISTNKQTEQQWEVQLRPLFRNLYAIIRDNSHHNSRPPSQSLWTPCWWCLLDITQSLPTRNTGPHQQFPSPNTIHQRRRKQLCSSIPWHVSPTKLRQNHLGKNLQKTNTYKPIPEIYIINPTSAKQSVTTALLDRADNVVSNKMTIQKNSCKEQSKSTTREKNSQESARKKNLREPKQIKSINLPYIQGVSEQLRWALNKHNIKATFHTQTTLRNLLLKPKDSIPKDKKEQCCIPT